MKTWFDINVTLRAIICARLFQYAMAYAESTQRENKEIYKGWTDLLTKVAVKTPGVTFTPLQVKLLSETATTLLAMEKRVQSPKFLKKLWEDHTIDMEAALAALTQYVNTNAEVEL